MLLNACFQIINITFVRALSGRNSGSPGAVVKAACLESQRSRVRNTLCHSSFKETKCVLLAHS